MNTTTLTYRPLSESDLDSVAALEALCFSTPWTKEQYAAMICQGGCSLFGALQGNTLAGYIAVSASSAVGEMEVYNIAVAESFRRKGIGRKLMALAMAAAAMNGITETFLEVRESNRAAITLYESIGFIKAGVRKDYYHDTKEDAFIYTHNMQTMAPKCEMPG